MNKVIFSPLLIVLSFFLFSCSVPRTKEAYMEKLDNLIVEVGEARRGFTVEDWAECDEVIDKFTGEYYEKFAPEFTLSEKLKIGKLLTKYGYYRSVGAVKNFDYKATINGIKEFVEKDLRQDVEDAGEAVEDYWEGDFQQDVENAIESVGDIIDDVMDKFHK